MDLNEAMKQLILGKCVGRYSVPGLKLKIVDKKECPGLSDEELKKLGGTAVVDISIVTEDGMNTKCDGDFYEGVYSFRITYDEMKADDYYIYSDTENLTTEQAYIAVREGKKVYNDYLWPGGFYLAKYKDENGKEEPALYYPDGECTRQLVYSNSDSPWWKPNTYEEFENHYYIKE